jgi:uncharacterized protein YdhG (YjbR/CyaY superfamily)
MRREPVIRAGSKKRAAGGRSSVGVMTISETSKKNGRAKAAGGTSEEAAGGFSAEERAAMKDRAAELKAAKHGATTNRADGERALLDKVAAMDEPDRGMAERLHALLSATVPELAPQTWYGMPAYAKDGKVVLYFKPGQKYKMRYCTLGFSDKAALDDGDMWPSEFAVTRWSDEVEARITALVQRALG